jgi:superfamily I DNA/RNA helicase
VTAGRFFREARLPGMTPGPVRVPSESQRAAIEAPAEPLLVLAGPGAGKTFCLIERIRYLLEQLGFSPDRVCAFTFTNKAAGEIAERLQRTLGENAALVKTGTIHAFCAELLREFGSRIGIAAGFGIADEAYQRAVLRRLGQSPRWHGTLLGRFGAHRFRGVPFQHRNDAEAFERYERFLIERRVLDFDMLVIRAAELLADAGVVQRVRARWDCVLVDEFQDLNPFQYQVVRELGRDHAHIFAVGDEEQSIYSWAGADPHVFLDFMNDFGLTTKVSLRENRRCPREILALARRLVEINAPMFPDRKVLQADRESAHCVEALTFATDDDELAWIIEDVRRQHDEHGVAWGDIALLYRRHQIGEVAEAGFLAAGLPCRLASGHALADDAVVAYVIAALRVIACSDDIHEEGFLEAMLSPALRDDARARAEASTRTLRKQLACIARELPRDHGDAKQIRRAFYALNNLGALGCRHTALPALVEELLAQRVGAYRSILEEHHDALTDPRDHAEVVRLAERLRTAQETGRGLWLPRLRGVEIALKGMLGGAGLRMVSLGGTPPHEAERLCPEDAPVLGLSLALFKALQLLRVGSFPNVSATSRPSTWRRPTATWRAPRSSRSRPCACAMASSPGSFTRSSGRGCRSRRVRRGRTGSRSATSPPRRLSRRCGRGSASSAAAMCSSRTTGISSTFRSCAAWPGKRSARTTRFPSPAPCSPAAASSRIWPASSASTRAPRIARWTMRARSPASASRCTR